MAYAKQHPVKIALVCPDGLSILLFCRGIIRTLQRIRGSRVFVLCEFGDHEKLIGALDVSCVPVPVYRWFDPLEDLKYFWRLSRAMKRHKFDVVLQFSTKPNIFGSFAAKLAGVRLNFMHVVGLGSGFEQRSGIRGKILSRIFVDLYRLACRWSASVWFTNPKDLQFFIDHGLVQEKKAVLSRNYLDTREYSAESVNDQQKAEAREICGLDPGEKMVLMVARLIWQKGIREFAEAAELLRESNPGLKFVLVAPQENGSPDVVPETFLREKERNGNFRWLGFQKDVRRIYAIADLAVLPTYYKEGGYPRALLEPMSMGKPVITTTSEDCRGAVEEGKNGFLVPVRDSKALAAAIDWIMSDGPLRESFEAYSRIKAVRDFEERSIVPDALRRMGMEIPVSDEDYRQ